MPRSAAPGVSADPGFDYYEIAVRQFEQQILPPGLPATMVWGYGSIHHPNSFAYPAPTIEARWQRPVRVKWVNDLRDPVTGRFRPHLFAVDPTLHWANPAGGNDGRDSRPSFNDTPTAYRGPVPIVTHLHGGHSSEESDGYPEAWYLPAAEDIPKGYATEGKHYAAFNQAFAANKGVAWEAGSAVYEYGNEQRAAALWYHDHALGITRLSMYAGLAGFYLLRGGPDDLTPGVLAGPAPAADDRAGIRYREIPLLIQDRSFNADGSLFYPADRAYFDDFAGPYIPHSDIPPIWNPEFFGDAIVVNGRTWPYLEVEPRRYRLRLLNGCNARVLILQFSDARRWWQIGSDGGFLPRPLALSQLRIAPGERIDAIVDFAGLAPGARLSLRNLGPDEPYGGGVPGKAFKSADPQSTGQVMQFRIVALEGTDHTTPPQRLHLPAIPTMPPPQRSRELALVEEESARLPNVGPRVGMLGTVRQKRSVGLMWSDPDSETPEEGTTELWELHNTTDDAHPIHLHQVQFEIVGRQGFHGRPRGPEPADAGRKDTVVAYPGAITRIKAHFGRPGRYVWHCHILEHEDNEMMRPLVVMPKRS